MTKQEILEDSTVAVINSLLEQSRSQIEKTIYDLYKSAILKKHKDLFNQELSEGIVQNKTIDKAVEYCYSDICASIRQMPKLCDDEKDSLIERGKLAKNPIKETIRQILLNKGIEIRP